jgi:hypothetical protein
MHIRYKTGDEMKFALAVAVVLTPLSPKKPTFALRAFR